MHIGIITSVMGNGNGKDDQTFHLSLFHNKKHPNDITLVTLLAGRVVVLIIFIGVAQRSRLLAFGSFVDIKEHHTTVVGNHIIARFLKAGMSLLVVFITRS